MPKVFVTNRGGHDYSAAQRFGDIIYLTEGHMAKFNTSQMYRQCEEGLRNSKPGDYILLTSLTTLCSIACGIFAHKHHRLNLLIHKDGAYVERVVVLDNQGSETYLQGNKDGQARPIPT